MNSMQMIQKLFAPILIMSMILLLGGCGQLSAEEVLEHTIRAMKEIQSYSSTSISNIEQAEGSHKVSSYKDTLITKAAYDPYKLYTKEMMSGDGKETGTDPFYYEQEVYVSDHTIYFNTFSTPNHWVKKEWHNDPLDLTKSFQFIQEHSEAFAFAEEDDLYRFSVDSTDDLFKSFWILIAASSMEEKSGWNDEAFKNMVNESELLGFQYEAAIDKDTYRQVSSKMTLKYKTKANANYPATTISVHIKAQYAYNQQPNLKIPEPIVESAVAQ
ncbi:MAG TPA: DUF6612 family protein [Bacillales bacterium]|nr:DUF6612 family protein [Bacillales bacterium]